MSSGYFPSRPSSHTKTPPSSGSAAYFSKRPLNRLEKLIMQRMLAHKKAKRLLHFNSMATMEF